MKTIEELKRENEKLKNALKAKQEMIEIGRRRNDLIRKNKSLMRQVKYGSTIATGKKVKKHLARTGKAIGKGILRVIDNIEENQKREMALQRKQKKTLKRVATGRKKYTRNKSVKKKTVKRKKR